MLCTKVVSVSKVLLEGPEEQDWHSSGLTGVNGCCLRPSLVKHLHHKGRNQQDFDSPFRRARNDPSYHPGTKARANLSHRKEQPGNRGNLSGPDSPNSPKMSRLLRQRKGPCKCRILSGFVGFENAPNVPQNAPCVTI